MQEIDEAPVIYTTEEPTQPPAHRPKLPARKIRQKQVHLSPRQLRRALKRLEFRYERKKKHAPMRCVVCFHLILGPSSDRCQCKAKMKNNATN